MASQPIRSSYAVRSNLCGMPDSEDYEDLGRLLVSPPSWTPTEADFMHRVIGSRGGATVFFATPQMRAASLATSVVRVDHGRVV